MSDCKPFWEEAVKTLYNGYSEQNKEDEFRLWISVLEYIESKGNTIIVSVPSAFFKDQLKRRGDVFRLESILSELSGQNLQLDFEIRPRKISPSSDQPVVQPSAPFSAKTAAQAAGQSSFSSEQNSATSAYSQQNASNTYAQSYQPAAQNYTQNSYQAAVQNSIQNSFSSKKSSDNHPKLRNDYTFENFVLGENNSFAYNAAMAVAKNPGHAYNPVLIYGGVGLGKTHLMQSIGNLAWNENKCKVIYVTAEEFTNEFIQAINDKTTTKFKNKYRSADVLLIDDIHFLQNKDGTQEELFHTFNALYDSYKQMVFTCDRPIYELKNLSERLRTRFERGLNVDLQPPKYETRRAIIESKLKKMNREIDSDVIDFIAQNVASNVRELEAALTKILAYTDLIGKTVNVDIAQSQLRDTINSPKQANISIETIVKVVSDNYGVSISDIKGKKRTKNVMLPRQIALYIARELTEYSTTELGAEFGGRDHTTVMHSCQKIEEAIKADSNFEMRINSLIRSIKDYKKSV